jgi:hypothetical protein
MLSVYLLVATIMLPGYPTPVRVVPAQKLFYRSLSECEQQRESMRRSPLIIDLICSRHVIDPSTGHILFNYRTPVPPRMVPRWTRPRA